MDNRFIQAINEIVSSIKHLGYLIVLDKWSSEPDSYFVYKVSAPGLGQYSLEFEREGVEGGAFLFEGEKLVRACYGISEFPEIIRHLPSSTYKMATVLPLTQSEFGLTDEQAEMLISQAGGGSRKERALAISKMLSSPRSSHLSTVDLVIKDLNQDSSRRVASKYLGK